MVLKSKKIFDTIERMRKERKGGFGDTCDKI